MNKTEAMDVGRLLRWVTGLGSIPDEGVRFAAGQLAERAYTALAAGLRDHEITAAWPKASPGELAAEVERLPAIRDAGDKARILAGIRGDLLHETRQKLDAAQRAGRELQDQAARMAEENTRLVAEVERLTAALTAAGIVERVGGLIDQWLDGELDPHDALTAIHEQVGDR